MGNTMLSQKKWKEVICLWVKISLNKGQGIKWKQDSANTLSHEMKMCDNKKGALPRFSSCILRNGSLEVSQIFGSRFYLDQTLSKLSYIQNVEKVLENDNKMKLHFQNKDL
jgi:hypothetical protein